MSSQSINQTCDIYVCNIFISSDYPDDKHQNVTNVTDTVVYQSKCCADSVKYCLLLQETQWYAKHKKRSLKHTHIHTLIQTFQNKLDTCTTWFLHQKRPDSSETSLTTCHIKRHHIQENLIYTAHNLNLQGSLATLLYIIFQQTCHVQ
jgi:hypothetical protein